MRVLEGLTGWRAGALGVAAVCAVLWAPCAAWADNPLRIGVQFGMGYIPFYVADRDGLFEKHFAAEGVSGVTVSFPRFSGSPPLNEALISGQIEMATYAVTGLIVAWDKTRGTPSALVGVCGTMTHPTAMITLKPEMKTLKDVTSEDRIAIPAPISTSAYVLRIGAEQQFGNATKFDQQIVSMPNPDAVIALLSHKIVTAHFTVPPFTDYELRQPGGHVVLGTEQVFGGPTTTNVLVASDRYARANPGIIKAVIGALDEANQAIVKDPRRAADIYLEYEPSKTFDAAFIAELLADGHHGYATTPLGVMKFVDYFIRHNEMKNKPQSWKDLFLPYIEDRAGS